MSGAGFLKGHAGAAPRADGCGEAAKSRGLCAAHGPGADAGGDASADERPQAQPRRDAIAAAPVQRGEETRAEHAEQGIDGS